MTTTTAEISKSNHENESEISLGENISHSTEEKSHRRQESANEFLIKNTLYNNCDNIYTEFLIQILNNNTEDLQPQPIASEDLMDFLMNAFKISQEKHSQLLNIAKSRKGPTFHLNVGIIKVKNLLPKDLKGVLGYFINLYMESNVVNQYHTSVQYVTSDPSWDEFFFFPLRGDPKQETLVVEVCKLFDPDHETPKTNVLGDLKNVLKKIKSPPKPRAFKTIGKTEVPLNSITGSAAIRVWYTFKKGLRNPQKRGSILMQLAISVEKDKRIVAREHEVLLMRLFQYEQENSPSSSLWNGKLSNEADTIIKQHYIRSGLSENDDFFMKWIAYTAIHEEKHLSFGLLRTTLHEIIKILPTLGGAECVENFWGSVQRVLPSCFEVIWKIRDDIFKENQGISMLIDVLGIFQEIESLEIPEDVELLANLDLVWLYKSEEKNSVVSIEKVLNESIRKCTTEWLNLAEENFKNENKIQETTQIIQKMSLDMHRAIKFHHKHFTEIANIKYADILYECYVKILVETCKPTILEVCKNLPPLHVVDVNNFSEFSNDGDSTATAVHKQLFEIFLGVKRLVGLESCLSKSQNELQCLEYHEWFTPVVPFWVETAIQNALTAIKKSIDLDEFKTIDEHLHHSSSALDTLSIFYQIKAFWDQIDWPNVEDMFLFFGRIVDGICRCCIYYATNISAKLSKYNSTEHKLADFEITKEWCVVTCNINEITNKLSSFTHEDLGAESIIEKIGANLNSPEAQRCAITIKNIVSNCQDNLENEIKILIEQMVGEIVCMIQNFLLINIDNLTKGTGSFEDIYIFLDRNLSVLNTELVGTTFNAMIETLHETLLVMLYKIAQSSLDTYRPPSFFVNLQEVINIMTVCLKNEKKLFSEKTSTILFTLSEFLQLHASKTETLIHNYYQEILQRQKHDISASSSSSYGQLTIQANISNANMLQVTVLNGKLILPESSKKNANTYVKMHFVPPDRFAKVPTQKTAVKSKTTFPLYEEEFKIYLSTPQQQLDDNILVFIVKIKDLFRTSNKYFSECYVSFEEIKKSNGKQIHLNLFRPESADLNSIIITELEYRKIFDKTAQNFISKLREKNICKP